MRMLAEPRRATRRERAKERRRDGATQRPPAFLARSRFIAPSLLLSFPLSLFLSFVCFVIFVVEEKGLLWLDDTSARWRFEDPIFRLWINARE
jgi:hypothetical protein